MRERVLADEVYRGVVMANEIPIERLHEVFVLSDAGELLWRKTKPGRAVAGKKAGSICNGYVCVMVDKVPLKAHRVVFAMTRGRWPENFIDHIDGDKANNRPDNLRDVSHQVNTQNISKPGRTNKSGFLGVSLHSRIGRWQAQIWKDGKVKCLGYYQTPEEAHAVYVEAKRKHHEGCTL